MRQPIKSDDIATKQLSEFICRVYNVRVCVWFNKKHAAEAQRYKKIQLTKKIIN
jgi:hypothetical protein